MTQAQTLAQALNALVKSPQFSYVKARAAARQDGNVDWPRTKAHNEDFNPEVDGCESFVMRDGSLCAWVPASFKYAARSG
jgi:recombination DNA repair RAD52 pathway protein